MIWKDKGHRKMTFLFTYHPYIEMCKNIDYIMLF